MLGRTNTGGGGVGGVLTVTAPAGVVVEVSKDGKTKRKTSNAEGIAVFKGLATGTWQLTITDGQQTSTKSVAITADYSAVIAFFAATINITYPAGSTCTCTDGTTTMTAPDTSGTWACIVPNTGTWTVTITDGNRTKSSSVSITADGQGKSLTLSYATDISFAKSNWKSFNPYPADQYEDYTSGYSYSTSKFVATVDKDWQMVAIASSGTYDLTNVDNIKFKATLSKNLEDNCNAFVAVSKTQKYFDLSETQKSDADIVFKTKVTSKDSTLLVTGLRGKYYILVGMYAWYDNGTTKFTVENMKLE